MVMEWTKENPVVWNIGIGPAASFMPTLARILFERTKEIYVYGPHDFVSHVRLSPAAECSVSLVALEILMGVASSLKMLLPGYEDELQELKQLVAEESYYAYGMASPDLMVKAFGSYYIDPYRATRKVLGGPNIDPNWTTREVLGRPNTEISKYDPPMHERIAKALKGKRCLVVIENLRVPISLDIVIWIMAKLPGIFNNRWLISAASMDVYNRSRQRMHYGLNFHRFQRSLNVSSDYCSVLPFDYLTNQDLVSLFKEAQQDAARSIHNALKVRDEIFWLWIAYQCLSYCILYHPLGGAAITSTPCISSDELVRCWVSEHLLHNIRGPSRSTVTDITSMRQSNYRSAYEDGKVVIKALQEYSLLPTYTPTGTSSGSKDAITGLSILAKDVPRLKKDDLSQRCNINRQKIWVSFLNDDGREVSLDDDISPQGKMNMTTLILRSSSGILDFPFHEVFTPILRVLDLSYTQINSLPPWFSLLPNLILLSLRGCSKLYRLSPPPPYTSQEETPPLAHLGSLQVLDMNGVPLSELTNQDGSNKGSLHYLDLSGSRVTTLPSEFFSEMSNLEELILVNCSNLNELPSSLAKVSNLLILCVEGTQITTFPDDTFDEMQRLHTLKLINNKRLISLPLSLSKARGLKELHIYNCARIRLQYLLELVSCLESLYIQTWQGLESIEIHGHPNLKTFSLSGRWIRCLSLRGCRKLKTVNFSDDITALEAVDLSETTIEEVPHNLPNLPQLRMLLLLNVPCFKRFPWHQLVRFPKVFCLSHCEDDNSRFSSMFVQQKICADENQHTEKTTNTAQININDSRMFLSFNAEATDKLVKGGQFLQSFSVQVKSCSARGKEPWNKEIELCANIQRLSPYRDVCYSEAAGIMPMLKLQPRQRHVEISAIMDWYPRGLRQLLSVTHSIFITDDASVRCLTDLNDSLMSLEECQLQQCHLMAIVLRMNSKGSEDEDEDALSPLRMNSKGSEDALSSLKIVQVCNLENLVSFVEPSDVSESELITLKLLKHIHIENCPRLQKMFPCSLSLPSLESLVILFCTNLKTIFYKQSKYRVAPSPLPKIKRIYLQELPQLQHIHDDAMFAFETPKWESLFVRGCRSFRCLPLLKKEYLKSKVKVNGEHDWWDKLQLRLPEQSDYYCQVRQPEFASRKKCIIIRSYLR